MAFAMEMHAPVWSWVFQGSNVLHNWSCPENSSEASVGSTNIPRTRWFKRALRPYLLCVHRYEPDRLQAR
jgi:hypothetical protein